MPDITRGRIPDAVVYMVRFGEQKGGKTRDLASLFGTTVGKIYDIKKRGTFANLTEEFKPSQAQKDDGIAWLKRNVGYADGKVDSLINELKQMEVATPAERASFVAKGQTTTTKTDEMADAGVGNRRGGEKTHMTPRQCEIAAESYTACLLAQAGYDILVQYGANQPHYDLIAVKNKNILLISVKGSQDGGWLLAVPSPRTGVDYHAAIGQWLSAQRDDIVYVFVQFMNVPLGQAPRAFVARPPEIATHMKTQRSGHGRGSLQEDYRRDHPRAQYDDKIPDEWGFTYERIDTI